jgi:zinc protease
MREVRVKRGLTYSIGSYISSQKEYGRAGISTFTKNETINPLVEVIYNTVKNIMDKGITSDELDRIKSGLKGSHPFKFESNKTFLVQLLYLDHVGQSYDELFDFNQKLDAFTATEVREKIKNVFDPKKQSVFILGDKKIEGDLKKLSKKYGKLKVLDFKSFI